MKNIGKYNLTKSEIDCFIKEHNYLLKDGRQLGKIAETWVAKFVNGVKQPENSPFDVLTKKSDYYGENIRIEVRSAIKKVSFAASKEVGYGRQVTENGFKEKLNNLDVFIIIDSRNIENGYVEFIEINKTDIQKLGLGKTKSINANKFWEKINKWK